jgi:hypothetical protein
MERVVAASVLQIVTRDIYMYNNRGDDGSIKGSTKLKNIFTAPEVFLNFHLALKTQKGFKRIPGTPDSIFELYLAKAPNNTLSTYINSIKTAVRLPSTRRSP